MELQKNKMLSWLGCALLLTVCTCNAVIAYAQGTTCTVQTFQPTAPLPAPAGWMPPASGQTQPTPPALIPVKWSGIVYIFNNFNGWGGMSVNASLQFDTPDAACQSLLIYQSWAGNLYCVNAKAGPLPSWGYQGNCSCADPNTRGLYEPRCPSGSIPANDSLGGVACRTVNANLIKKPSDGICNMIAQGNAFVADNGGGFNGGDPDCNSACTVQCPAHASGTPPSCVCDDDYKLDAAGTSCVPEQYTISLVGLGGEVMPTKTLNAYALVTRSDGTAKSGVYVDLTLTVVPELQNQLPSAYTGSLSANTVSTGTTTYAGATGPDGRLKFVFKAPEAGGVHTITATCANNKCSNQATGEITVPGCSADPLTDIKKLSELWDKTPEEVALTQKLEGGMNGYSLLTKETQDAEKCLAGRIQAVLGDPSQSGYQVTSTVRTYAYQRHFREVWDRFFDLKKKSANDPSIQQRCQALIAKVEGEMGFRINQNPKDTKNVKCNNALGRAHCIRVEPAISDPKHAKNVAFDIPPDTVLYFKGLLAPPTTVQKEANACGLTWGGTFDPIDEVHFLLP